VPIASATTPNAENKTTLRRWRLRVRGSAVTTRRRVSFAAPRIALAPLTPGQVREGRALLAAIVARRVMDQLKEKAADAGDCETAPAAMETGNENLQRFPSGRN
jgi:hypothetical protein